MQIVAIEIVATIHPMRHALSTSTWNTSPLMRRFAERHFVEFSIRPSGMQSSSRPSRINLDHAIQGALTLGTFTGWISTSEHFHTHVSMPICGSWRYSNLTQTFASLPVFVLCPVECGVRKCTSHRHGRIANRTDLLRKLPRNAQNSRERTFSKEIWLFSRRCCANPP